MGFNLLHIAEGWGKSLGWIGVTPDQEKLSNERMKICATSGKNGGHCDNAKASSILKMLHGEAREMDAIYCSGCGCPVNEKSLVTGEKCPLNKW